MTMIIFVVAMFLTAWMVPSLFFGTLFRVPFMRMMGVGVKLVGVAFIAYVVIFMGIMSNAYSLTM